MMMIGICGASGSGKSTIAKELARRFDGRCVYLKQDSYYIDHSDMSFEERERINYDDPNAFEHEALLEDLRRLCNDQAIFAKNYDYSLHCRCDSKDEIGPAPLVLLEGIHVFYDPAIRDMLDLKVFMQVDPDVCLLRRMKRDIRDRGRSVESVYRQYLDTVKPMYEKYIRGYAEYADLIVAHGGKNEKVIDILTRYIEETIG